MLKMVRIAGNRMLRLLVVAGLGVALAACDKCIMPTWQPNRTAPVSCHDDGAAK